MISHQIIDGSIHLDDRGKLNFFSNFDMKEIVRMYEISPSSTKIIRGWQGHKNENKWFYCASGSFTLCLAEITSFDDGDKENSQTKITLESKKPSILHITGGYATAFKANEENAVLTVFSNFSVAESMEDDYRFSLDKWPVNF